MMYHQSLNFMQYDERSDMSSIEWLKLIKNKFKHTVWLNPITKSEWDDSYGSFTLNKIRDIFRMEDLTLQGIKNAVEYLNQKV
jgi:uncharacterized protein with von Willebrand factor type A (vWA) domain